ncbi:cytochrome c and c1 heme-lyase [Ramicandelaber brevisporus]|nr:cytochrome c and c1 heme-lyase [Ramicandelaber brevisporus]
MSSSGCPVKHDKSGSESATVMTPHGLRPAGAKCPVEHGSSSSSTLDPRNFMPSDLANQPQANQAIELPTERTVSSIPRVIDPSESAAVAAAGAGSGYAASAEDTNWVYPSPQQFYNALVRKGWETPEEHVEMMVQIHNFLNEGCWDEVVQWERRFHPQDSEDVKLLRLQGRPRDLSPKAWFMSTFMGAPRPFDRHDWFVDRNGKTVRYVIDYYEGEPEAPGVPVFHVDVRPAVDDPTSAWDRLRMAWSKARDKYTSRTANN